MIPLPGFNTHKI